MERIQNALLEELLENVADLGWSYIICQEPEGNYNGWHQERRNYVELSKMSPMGEDFRMVIDFDREDAVETFRENLKEYAYTFDINEHVEKWIPYRGQGGCPRDIRNLIENAEDIDSMVIELGRRVTVEAEKARLF